MNRARLTFNSRQFRSSGSGEGAKLAYIQKRLHVKMASVEAADNGTTNDQKDICALN